MMTLIANSLSRGHQQFPPSYSEIMENPDAFSVGENSEDFIMKQI